MANNPYNDYFKALKLCSNAAQADFMKIWSLLDLTNPEAARDMLLELLPPLVNKYGDVAATAAAEMYEAVIIAEKGIYKAAEMGATYGESIKKSVRYASGLIFDGDTEKAKNALSLAVDYYSKQPARDTVYNSVTRDKKIGARYARVPQGETTCEFCIMLASRGFVYTSKQAAGADGGNKYHTSCDCLPVPAFVDNPVVEGYDPEALYEQYKQIQDKGKFNRAKRKN